jgi:hypothetical protein
MLRFESAEMFNDKIDVVRDASGCALARRFAEDARSGLKPPNLRCKKSDDICDQDEHLTRRVGDVRSVATALVNRSPSDRVEDIKRGKLALGIIDKGQPRDWKGRNCYGMLGGDMSIALECEPDETILTTDKAFDVIAPAIGRKLRRISPSRGFAS